MSMESTSALDLGSEVTNKNHKNAKSMALNIPWKERLFTVWGLKQKVRLSLFMFKCDLESASIEY